MLRATRILRAEDAGDIEPVDHVHLEFDDRQRRRIKMKAISGLAFLLDLERPSNLRQGDLLFLEDGRAIGVQAAPEAVFDVIARNSMSLARLAWHLGNRHCPSEILADRLRIRRDHVLKEMLEGLGASVEPVAAPFNPETGAYARHGHQHEH